MLPWPDVELVGMLRLASDHLFRSISTPVVKLIEHK